MPRVDTEALSFSSQRRRSIVRYKVSRRREGRYYAKQQPRREFQDNGNVGGLKILSPHRRTLGVELELDDIKSRADIARREKDIDIVLEASLINEHRSGRVSSRQNHDIKEQETGVELVLKLPQIAAIINYALRAAPRTALFYGLRISTLSPISAYEYKPPCVSEPLSFASQFRPMLSNPSPLLSLSLTRTDAHVTFLPSIPSA